MPNKNSTYLPENLVADILGISKRNLSKFKKEHPLFTKSKEGFIPYKNVEHLPEFIKMRESNWEKEMLTEPKKKLHFS